LFRELLFLEVAYRDRRGDQFSTADYSSRFPRYKRAVQKAFQDIGRLPAAFPPANQDAEKLANGRSQHAGYPCTNGFAERGSTTSNIATTNATSSPQTGVSPNRRHDCTLEADRASENAPNVLNRRGRSEPNSDITILGDYRLLERLGKGAMGVV